MLNLREEPMRKLRPVDRQDADALALWLRRTRASLEAVRVFLLDATLPQNERIYSRKYLRRIGLRRIHDLEAHLAAIDPDPPAEPAPVPPAEPAPADAAAAEC